MPTDLLTRPKVDVEEVVGDGTEDCLVCLCRPRVTFCGRYDDRLGLLVEWDPDDTCAECVGVNDTGCPNCGCRGSETCQLCSPRPWWRRWLS